MHPFSKLIVVGAVVALSGCAASSYCEGEHDYMSAQSVPPIEGAEGLRLPESSSALRIPPAPAQVHPYAETYTDADGDERIRCLDAPPMLAPLALPPEPPKEAPAETPAPPAEAPAPAEPPKD